MIFVDSTYNCKYLLTEITEERAFYLHYIVQRKILFCRFDSIVVFIFYVLGTIEYG